MISDTEAKLFGPWVMGIGLMMVAAGAARFIWPSFHQADYFSVMLLSCGLPAVLAYTAYGLSWLVRELWPAPIEVSATPTPPATPLQQAAQRAATLAEQDASIHAHHWRQAIHRFLTAGDKHGFGVRVMAAKTSPHKVIAWNAWGEMVRVLRDAGILVGAGDGTKWAPEWNYHRWLELKDTLSISCPKGEPPDVMLSVSNIKTTNSKTPSMIDNETGRPYTGGA